MAPSTLSLRALIDAFGTDTVHLEAASMPAEEVAALGLLEPLSFPDSVHFGWQVATAACFLRIHGAATAPWEDSYWPDRCEICAATAKRIMDGSRSV